MNHTPGPWKAVDVTSEKTLVYRRIDAGKKNVGFAGSYKQRDTTEAEANARLIAAAPELLEALELIADRKNWTTVNGELVWNDFYGNEFITEHAIDIARAAIAKAKGE
jgi:hypothetical protein